MIYLKMEELNSIVGGINLTGSILSAFNSIFSNVLDAGRSFGTAIRRIFSRRLCSL